MARSFAGGASTDGVNCGKDASIDNQTDLTMTCWINPTDSAMDDDYHMSKRTSGGDGKKFGMTQVGGTNALHFKQTRAVARSEAISVASVMTTNEWQFVAATWKTDEVPKLYRATAGNKVAEMSYDTQVAGSGGVEADALGRFGIGNVHSNNRGFGGRVADCRYFNDRIDNVNVLTSIMMGRFVRGDILIGWWPVNGSSPEVDWSKNTNMTDVTGTTIADGPPIGPHFGFDQWISGGAVGVAAPVPMAENMKKQSFKDGAFKRRSFKGGSFK